MADSLVLRCDASEIGYGATLCTHWVAQPWSKRQLEQAWRTKATSSTWLEAAGIVSAISAFANRPDQPLRGKRLTLYTDNTALVQLLNKFTSRAPGLMDLTYSLLLIRARFSFAFRAFHVPREQNIMADTLSRLNASVLRGTTCAHCLQPYDQWQTLPHPMPVAMW